MSQIIFDSLDTWLSKYTDKVDETIGIIADLWEKFHLFPIQCKAAIDELSHPDLVASLNPITDKCKEVLNKLIDEFGLYSIVYQSICKMIIDCELSAKDIKKSVREAGVLPAAFVPAYVAHPSLDMWPVVSFVNNVFDKEYESDPSYWDRYVNLINLRKILKKKMKQFFKRRSRVRRLIRLSNGSSTRIEDGVNIQDLNGSIYVTNEQVKLIQNMKPLLDWLHIDNFREEFDLIETIQVENTHGSVNYAPDDSGKTRISFSLDSCIQVVSKALHELLDYMVKDLACNGTYRQQAVIRNMIKKQRHIKPGVILSTDMSKYSDTMQRDKMLEVLEWAGIPSDMIQCLDVLYSLPLWDSVLKKSTGSTNATYQGQYGDFPWITLMNIFNQLACYDYVNHIYGTKYIIKLELTKKKRVLICRNSTNSAVGDDTIMAFPGWKRGAKELFEIIKAIFNRVGVNINLSKTHWIQNGEGCCDFVKRFITSDGLVPYVRIQSIASISMDERCEELLRVYRDNMMKYEDWCELVDCFLPEPYKSELKELHVLNGGIVDRPISREDVMLFYFKNSVYSTHSSHRNRDEIRKWIEIVHKRYEMQLKDTHLISFLCQEIEQPEKSDWEEEWEDENTIFSSDDFDDDIDWSRESREIASLPFEEKLKHNFKSWKEVRSAFSEEELEEAILNSYTRGYEYPDFEGLSKLIGDTLADCLYYYPSFANFFNDYQQGEIYRYLYSNSKRKLDVYTRMFVDKYQGKEFKENIYRYPLQRLSRDFGKQIASIVTKHARWNTDNYFEKMVYGSNYPYYTYEGNTYRLYRALSSYYDILPKEAFLRILGYNEEYVEKHKEEIDALWKDYVCYIQ